MTPWITLIVTFIMEALQISYGLSALEESPKTLHKEYYGGFLKHSHPLLLTKRHLDHPTAASSNQNNGQVQKIYFDEKVPLELNCTFPTEYGNIIWERADLIYPLAVGAHIFSPDARLTLNFPQGNISQLIISNATMEDAKIYRCRSTTQKSSLCASETCTEQNAAFELTFNVIYGKPPSTKMQAIESSSGYPNVKSQVIIMGPALAFYGMPIELICRATFSSPEAKRDPTISLEWYHNGVRRRPSRSESGGTYITSRWIDSNLLESRLLITWTSEKEIGRWNCVERSQMNKRKLMNETGSIPIMSFDQLNLEIIAPPPISTFATTATFSSPEAVNPKSSKFRRYLQLKESSGGWRKTYFGSFSTKLTYSVFVSFISVLLDLLIVHQTAT